MLLEVVRLLVSSRCDLSNLFVVHFRHYVSSRALCYNISNWKEAPGEFVLLQIERLICVAASTQGDLDAVIERLYAVTSILPLVLIKFKVYTRKTA